jgi:hypothetical protein
MVRAIKQKQAMAKAVPLPLPRTVTLLGATGSIGSSTADLLRRDPDRYAVEAVTAHRDASALSRLARELNARFAAVADPAAYSDLKSELAGSGIEAAAGVAAIIEAAQRPADAGGRRTRRHGRACQQRVPGLRGRAVHAARRSQGRDRLASRFGAQRYFPSA